MRDIKALTLKSTVLCYYAPLARVNNKQEISKVTENAREAIDRMAKARVQIPTDIS